MKKRFVKLPNGNIVSLSKDGFFRVVVSVDMSEIIKNDLQGFLDILSDKATGTECLSDFSYSIVNHSGPKTLCIEVVGSADMIDIEEIDLESLPMLEFDVQVSRIGYGTKTSRLSARISEEAIEKALDSSGDHVYSESSSDYQAQAYLVA